MNNRNILLFTTLYDNTVQRIHQKVSKKNHNDPTVKEDVEYLNTVAQALFYVIQVEKLRHKSKNPSSQAETEDSLPPETAQPDKKPQQDHNKPSFGGPDLTNFHSPGGWQP